MDTIDTFHRFVESLQIPPVSPYDRATMCPDCISTLQTATVHYGELACQISCVMQTSHHRICQALLALVSDPFWTLTERTYAALARARSTCPLHHSHPSQHSTLRHDQAVNETIAEAFTVLSRIWSCGKRGLAQRWASPRKVRRPRGHWPRTPRHVLGVDAGTTISTWMRWACTLVPIDALWAVSFILGLERGPTLEGLMQPDTAQHLRWLVYRSFIPPGEGRETVESPMSLQWRSATVTLLAFIAGGPDADADEFFRIFHTEDRQFFTRFQTATADDSWCTEEKRSLLRRVHVAIQEGAFPDMHAHAHIADWVESTVAYYEMTRNCNGCGGAPDFADARFRGLRRCSKCRLFQYCTRNCQQAHWWGAGGHAQSHRAVCNLLARLDSPRSFANAAYTASELELIKVWCEQCPGRSRHVRECCMQHMITR